MSLDGLWSGNTDGEAGDRAACSLFSCACCPGFGGPTRNGPATIAATHAIAANPHIADKTCLRFIQATHTPTAKMMINASKTKSKTNCLSTDSPTDRDFDHIAKYFVCDVGCCQTFARGYSPLDLSGDARAGEDLSGDARAGHCCFGGVHRYRFCTDLEI